MAKDKETIEILRSYNRSPFDPETHGIKKDPTRDYRWVDPKRVSERKNMDAFEFTKGGGDEKRADRQVRGKGGMILMDRPREFAEQRAREKHLRTLEQMSTSKRDFEDRVEALSRKYDVDLHKRMKSED